MRQAAPHAMRITRTAQEAIVEALKVQILSGALEPGSQLRQGEIAEMLGVSTTPVREALRQLAAEGLVDGDPHKGMWVHRPTLAELDEVYRLLQPLERMAMEEAAVHFDDEVAARAQRVIDEMEGELGTPGWVQLNLEFHATLLEATGMPVLTELLGRLRNLSSIYVASSITESRATLDKARHEHRELLDALRRHDGAAAADIGIAHLEATHEMRRHALAQRSAVAG